MLGLARCAPPAPPAPPPLAVGCAPRADRPSKPAVKPRIKMRPLFWNRILINDSSKSLSHC